MIKYIKGLYYLCKIKFDIESCQDYYLLQHVLRIFMQAEGKIIKYKENAKLIDKTIPKRPFIVSLMPQFSERIFARIQEVRNFQDAVLSKKRILTKQKNILPERVIFNESQYKDGAFFKYNQVLLLTYPGCIAGIDYQDKT